MKNNFTLLSKKAARKTHKKNTDGQEEKLV